MGATKMELEMIKRQTIAKTNPTPTIFRVVHVDGPYPLVNIPRFANPTIMTINAKNAGLIEMSQIPLINDRLGSK